MFSKKTSANKQKNKISGIGAKINIIFFVLIMIASIILALYGFGIINSFHFFPNSKKLISIIGSSLILFSLILIILNLRFLIKRKNKIIVGILSILGSPLGAFMILISPRNANETVNQKSSVKKLEKNNKEMKSNLDQMKSNLDKDKENLKLRKKQVENSKKKIENNYINDNEKIDQYSKGEVLDKKINQLELQINSKELEIRYKELLNEIKNLNNKILILDSNFVELTKEQEVIIEKFSRKRNKQNHYSTEDYAFKKEFIN